MQPGNLLFILSDEHQRDCTGCYGDPVAITPNLDRLAARGVRFTSAYTPCPICVPARAALATGRWVHATRAWDNAAPYHGELPSWHHRLRAGGHRVVSIGKLHFRATTDDNGFNEEILPLHVLDGQGDLLGILREPPARPVPIIGGADELAPLVEAAWPRAQAHWSRFLLLGAPVSAPAGGRIVEILVAVGDTISEGDEVAVIET